ncbi:MAG TPA: proton-translocating transhydrogenase family protein [Rhizomicrobium sp.]|nr:proton-translocating transhydrogenase family protein [Rhizomicrobium sp.]
MVGALIAVAVSTQPKAPDAAVSTDQHSVVSVQNALSSPPVAAPDEVAAPSVSSATEDAGTQMMRHAWTSKLLGFVALILACVNIFGGFLVTARMLAMYRKKGQ